MKIRVGFWFILWVSGFLISSQMTHWSFISPQQEMAFAAIEQNRSLTLDLDQSTGEKETFQAVKRSGNSPWGRLWLLVSFLVYLLILAVIFLYVRKNKHILPHASIRLWAFPASAKILITIVLFMFGLVHAFGLWDAYLQTHQVFESAEEYFGYMKVTKLISLSHPHLFGFALMYLLVGGLFILTTWSEAVKSFILAIPILSATFDVLSWWMIKMVSSDFEWLTIFTGVSFGTGFGVMALVILQEMWLGKEAKMLAYRPPGANEKGKP